MGTPGLHVPMDEGRCTEIEVKDREGRGKERIDDSHIFLEVSYPAEVFEDAGNFVLPPEIGDDAQDGHQYYRSEQHVFPHGQDQLAKRRGEREKKSSKQS